jgi:indolepyruvate decarboxylase
MTTKAISVIEYIVQRLADEGITECFGVPGDYAFPVCDAVDRNPNIKWIGCSNELNASYAADGYARVRGAAMLSTTYAVGELSAINGVMGAKAERSLVFHVVGMPSFQNQRLRKTMHHTFGDGVFGNFIGISSQAACCYAVINPDNCTIEMERVIAEARRNNQPAYIVVPSDYALAAVTPTEVSPVTLKSNEAALKKAVDVVTVRLKSAIGRRLTRVHTVASRFTEGGTTGNRGARMSVCYHGDGKEHHRREPSAICRAVCGSCVRGEDAADRRGRRIGA